MDFFLFFRSSGLEDLAIAHVAQLAEHVLGKDEVISSILIMGSIFGNKNIKRKQTN